MGLFDFFKKKQNVDRVGGMEDFMTLIRVYYQAVLAANLGITNIGMLPDLATFKRTLKVATQNNKLGVAERGRCKKMLEQLYGMNEIFFKEIDSSIKKNCKKVQDVQPYLFAFQGFSNDLMMLVGNLMKWKFRVHAQALAWHDRTGNQRHPHQEQVERRSHIPHRIFNT